METTLRYIVIIAIAYGIGKGIYQSTRSRSLDYSAIWGYGCFLSFILFIYCIILIKSLVKSKAVRKWRPYILTVIEEIEKELE